MKPSITLFILVTLTQFYQTIQQGSCSTGCSSCNYDSSTQQSICSSCSSGFQLNSTLNSCVYTQCDSNLYLQSRTSPLQNQCVSICDDYYQVSAATNTCTLLDQCPDNFITYSVYSSNQLIQNILSYTNNTVLMQYGSFLNYVNNTSGEILLQFNITTSTVGVYVIDGQLISILSDFSVNQWNIETNEYINVDQVSQGSVNTLSQINYLQDQDYCISSFDSSKKLIYFNIIKTVPQTQAKFIQNQFFSFSTNEQKIYFFSQFIVTQANSNIKITTFLKNPSTTSYSMSQITPNFICSIPTSATIQNLLYSSTNNLYIFFCSNQPIVYVVDGLGVTCTSVTLSSSVLSIKLYQRATQSDLLVVQLGTSVVLKKLTDIQNSINTITISGNPTIIDVLINQLSSQIQFFLLTNQNQIINILSTSQDDSTAFNQIGSIPVIISSPLSLKYPSQARNGIAPTSFFVTGFDFQQIALTPQSTISTNYIIQSFRQSYQANKGAINKMYYDQTQSLLYACSADGMITIWNLITQFQVEYYKDFTFSNNSCRDFVLLQSKIIAVALNASIIVFDVTNPSQMQTYQQQNLQNISLFSLSTNQQYILIYLDSYIKIIDVNQNVLVNYLITTPLLSAMISINQNIYLYGATFIQTYTIDLTNQVLVASPSGLSSPQNIVFKFINESIPNKIYFSYYDQATQSLMIYDETFTLIAYAQVTTILTLLNVQPFIDLNNQLRFFISYQTNVASITSKYYFALINPGDTAITYVYNMFNSYGIIEIDNYFNSAGQLIFKIVTSSNVSYTCLLSVVKYNLVSAVGTVEQYQFNRNDSLSYLKQNKLFDFIFTGNGSGLVGISPSHPNYVNVIYQSKPSDPTNIISIKQSYQMNRIFIIKKVISEMDLVLTTYLGDILFDDSGMNSAEYVQGFQTFSDLRLIACFKSFQFLIKQYSVSPPTVYKLSNFGTINGYYLNENSQAVYIYGTKLSKFDLTLKTETVIISQIPQNKLIVQCVFPSGLIICKYGDYSLIFINSSDYSVLKQFEVSGIELGFSLTFDSANSFLYLYMQSIQIYTLSGIYINTLQQPTQGIIEFNFYGTHLVIFTVGNGYIYDRATQNYLTSFLSSFAGHIQKSLYLSNYNHVLYFSDETRAGQIFVFDLNLLIELNPISYVYNPTLQIVDVAYEKATDMLFFVDFKGNVELYYYSGAAYDQILPIDNFSNVTPSGFSIEFISNSLIIYNPTFVIQINYAICTRAVARYIDPIKAQSIVKTDTSGNNKYVIVDTSNIIYQYENYSLTYSTYQLDKIKGFFQTSDTTTVIVYFQTYFIVYLNSNFNLLYLSTNYSYKVTGYRIYRFLTDNIFQTLDFQLIHYDFVQNKVVYTLNIPTQYTVKCVQVANNLILLGLSSGMIIGYMSNSLQKFTIQLTSTSGIAYIAQTSSSFWFAQRDGSLTVYSSSNFNSSSSPLSTLNIVTITNNPSTIDGTPIDLNIFQVDELYGRFYVQFSKQKKLTVVSISTNTVIQSLSFPTDEMTKFKVTPTYLVLSSIAQLNVHRRDNLLYQFQIRCNNRRDQITNYLVINDTIFVLTFILRFDVYYVPSSTLTVQLVDTLTTQQPVIISANYNTVTTLLSLVGFSTTNIFDKKYWFQSYSNNSQACSSVINGETSVDFLRNLNIVISATSSQSQLFYLSLFDIDPINGINQSTTTMILKPQNSINSYFNINPSTFQVIKNNAYLKDFSFYLTQSGVYSFNTLTQSIYFQDIQIVSQNIYGSQFFFNQKQKVVINNLTLRLLSDASPQRILSSTQSNQEEEKSYHQFSEQNEFESYRVLATSTVTSFLYFNSCTTVMIYNLIIKQMDIRQLSQLIYFFNVNTVIIKNLTVESSQFNILLLFENIQNLTIENVTFLNNQALTLNFTNPMQLIVIQGCLLTTIGNVNVQNCTDYQILNIINQYQYNNEVIYFKNDVVNINGITSTSNVLSNVDTNSNFNQIVLQCTTLTLNNITFSSNQMSILIQSTTNILLTLSNFMNNQNLIGGAIQFSNIKGIVDIRTSTFKFNVARASGGAIYAENIVQINVDNKSMITTNSALIGGGIRIIGQTPVMKINEGSVIFNEASIFGNNIGTYPVDIDISSTQFNSSQMSFSKTIDQEIFGNLQIFNYQSGNSCQLNIAYLDIENRRISFSSEKVKSNLYPTIITNEISQWSIQIESLNVTQIQITGEQQVSYNQFDSINRVFVFDDMFINANPSSTQQLSLKFQISSVQAKNEVTVNLSFRQCITGEIYKAFSNSINICYVCSGGYYSIQTPKPGSPSECNKCPNEANICDKDNIVLEAGYWREDRTDNIYSCDSLKNSCNENDKSNLNGCVQGYLGPLCDQCDFSGQVWKERYSLNGVEQSCKQCSANNIQYLVVFSAAIGLLLYMLIQIQSFVKNFTLYQTCTYLRFANILPISASQTKTQNSFYIKCLMNYIQLQSILIDYEFQLIPQSLFYVPNFFGQPSSQIIVNFTCVLASDLINKYGIGKVQLTILTIIPIIYLLIILLVFFLGERISFQKFKVKSNYKYTALNFLFIFFQSDSINTITRFLTCRTIGSKQYITVDLTYECSDPDYVNYQRYFAIPLLIFWTIIPAIVYFMIQKRNRILNYCSSIFIYGYYYIEYRPTHYYWEFVRIYFKVTIVIFYTLYKQNGIIAHMIIVFLIALYNSFLQKRKPFLNPSMMKFEELSYFVLIGVILLKNLIDIYQNNFFQFLYVVVHISFIAYIILMIIYNRFIMRDTLVRQVVLFILKKVLRRYSFVKFQNLLDVKFQTFLYWKLIFRNLKNITNHKAIERISKIKPEQFEVLDSNQDHGEKINRIERASLSMIKNSNNQVFSMLMSQQNLRQTTIVSPRTKRVSFFHLDNVKGRPMTERTSRQQENSFNNMQAKFATDEDQDGDGSIEINAISQEIKQQTSSSSPAQKMQFKTMGQLGKNKLITVETPQMMQEQSPQFVNGDLGFSQSIMSRERMYLDINEQ